MKIHHFILSLLIFAVCVNAQPTKPAPQPQAEKKQKVGQDKDKNAGDSQDPQKPDRIVTFNVRIPVAVVDKGGRFITNLAQSDFEIYEDKLKQEDIVGFKSESDLPLDIGLLMDTSNSVKPKLKFQRDAAVSFLQTVLRVGKDKALFLSFNSDIELQQDFTNRIDLLGQAIDKVKAYGETKLYDAVYRVCEEKMFTEAGRRRAIVLITDGEDTASEHTLEDAINIALRTETVVFVISNKAAGYFGVQGGQVDSSEDKNLKKLAEETGGRTFFTATTLELEKGFASVTKELRSQYIIAYQPTNTNPDGKFRHIEVKLTNRKDLKVRARKGYPGTFASDVKTN